MIEIKKKFTQMINVSGRVQGVGFRYYTYNIALQLGIKGWVKNMPDGSVRIIASGSVDNVYNLITYIKKGPPGARVESVAVTDYPETAEEFNNFTIRY